MRLVPGGGRKEPAATRRSARELEQVALTTLYTEHASAVRTFVRKYQSDSDRVEDCVQETFARVWRNIDRIRTDDGNPRAYLFTTARNVLTDEWRAQERRPRLVPDNDAVSALITPDSVDAALETITIGEAVGQLSREHRDVVDALFFQGLSLADASDLLNVPVGTVKSRGYYAIRSLRANFSEMGLL